jgi:ribosome-associated protein
MVPSLFPRRSNRSMAASTVRALARPGLRLGQNGEVPRPPILDVPISVGPIRVGQFLKLAGLAEHGVHAKELLEAGEVQVNGRVETRRGARLRTGDVVSVQGRRARLVTPPAA